MRCAQCGLEKDAGTTFTFYFGYRHLRGAAGSGHSRTASPDDIAGSEQVFLCYTCQIADRHHVFWRSLPIVGAVVVLVPALVGLLQFPSGTLTALAGLFAPVGAAFSAGSVAGAVVAFGIVASVGLLAPFAVRAFGNCLWIACSWRTPYAVAGDDADLDKTRAGELLAVRLRGPALREKGFDLVLTRAEYRGLERSTWATRLAHLALLAIALCVLTLFVLACVDFGSRLVGLLS